MKMPLIESFYLFYPGAEGDRLRDLGLLEVTGPRWGHQVDASEQLRSMFWHMPPPMEVLFPILTEYLICHIHMLERFTNQRYIEIKLKGLGMTEDGLDELERLLRPQ